MSNERPTEGFPDFAMVDTPGPIHAVNNVLTPPVPYPNRGWDEFEKPPRNYFNWLHRVTSKWIRYQEKINSHFTLSQWVDITDPNAILTMTQNTPFQIPINLNTIENKANFGGSPIEGTSTPRINANLTNGTIVITNTDCADGVEARFVCLLSGLTSANFAASINLTEWGASAIPASYSDKATFGNADQITMMCQDSIAASSSKEYQLTFTNTSVASLTFTIQYLHVYVHFIAA